MMNRELLAFVRANKLIAPGDRVTCAVSGGPDSMCLLRLLYQCAEELGISLVCAHYDHGLREESAADAAFVRSFCAQYDIPFLCGHGDVAAEALAEELQIFGPVRILLALRDLRNAALGGEELLDVPIYSESDLFFDVNNDGFYLGRDVAIYYNLNAGQNSTEGIQKRFPTSAIRLKDNGDMYSIYETDSGYRMYLFYDQSLDYDFTIGFPVVVKELLQFSDFAGLKVGDSIETVEAVDPVAGLYRKLLTEVWQLDAKGAKGHAAYGYPCTSIHYLSDGLLKIEYDMPEDGVLVLSGIEFAPDYILTDPIGRRVDYRIEEVDLPEQ